MERGERERPPAKRQAQTYTLEVKTEYGRAKAHVTLNRYPDGRLCGVFVRVASEGSDMRTAFDAWAMTASKGLQSGKTAKMLASAIRHINDDHGGTLLHSDVLLGVEVDVEVTSLWDALGLLLEVEG